VSVYGGQKWHEIGFIF